MGEDKGKGRASDVPTTSSHKDDRGSAEPPSKTTMFSKVMSSAIGLANSAISAPNLNETNSGGATVLGNSKSSQTGNTSSTSSWVEGSRSIVPNTSNLQPAGFRSEDEQQHVRQRESEFSSFLDGIDQFTPDVDDPLNESRTRNPNSGLLGLETELSSRPETLPNVTTNWNYSYNTRNVDLTIAEQEILDGQDVIGILSSASAMDESMEYDDGVEDFDFQLTPEQIRQIKSITNSLFPPETSHITPPVDHPLNMRPESLALDPIPTYSNISHLQFADTDASNGEYEEVRRRFITQWDGVLSGYTDEVWGNLLPLVREARQEVETIKNQSDLPEIPKALRRLGQIFNHLQK